MGWGSKVGRTFFKKDERHCRRKAVSPREIPMERGTQKSRENGRGMDVDHGPRVKSKGNEKKATGGDVQQEVWFLKDNQMGGDCTRPILKVRRGKGGKGRKNRQEEGERKKEKDEPDIAGRSVLKSISRYLKPGRSGSAGNHQKGKFNSKSRRRGMYI